MAENTQVGPAGGNASGLKGVKPANHNTSAKDGRSGGGFHQGTGADADSASLSPSGPLKPVQGS